EAIAHFLRENGVQLAEIHTEAGERVDGPAHGDFADVAVTVKVRMRAGAEHRRVALVVPFRTTISVCRGEGDAPREVCNGHGGKMPGACGEGKCAPARCSVPLVLDFRSVLLPAKSLWSGGVRRLV